MSLPARIATFILFHVGLFATTFALTEIQPGNSTANAEPVAEQVVMLASN